MRTFSFGIFPSHILPCDSNTHLLLIFCLTPIWYKDFSGPLASEVIYTCQGTLLSTRALWLYVPHSPRPQARMMQHIRAKRLNNHCTRPQLETCPWPSSSNCLRIGKSTLIITGSATKFILCCAAWSAYGTSIYSIILMYRSYKLICTDRDISWFWLSFKTAMTERRYLLGGCGWGQARLCDGQWPVRGKLTVCAMAGPRPLSHLLCQACLHRIACIFIHY